MRFHRRSLNFNLISSYLQSLIRLESFYFTTRNSQHFRLFRPSNRSLHQRNPLIKTRKSRLTKNSSSPHFNSRNCFYFHGRNLRLVSLKNSSRFWNGPVCISFNRFSQRAKSYLEQRQDGLNNDQFFCIRVELYYSYEFGN